MAVGFADAVVGTIGGQLNTSHHPGVLLCIARRQAKSVAGANRSGRVGPSGLCYSCGGVV
jgi:hypothetical protein